MSHGHISQVHESSQIFFRSTFRLRNSLPFRPPVVPWASQAQPHREDIAVMEPMTKPAFQVLETRIIKARDVSFCFFFSPKYLYHLLSSSSTGSAVNGEILGRNFDEIR